MAIQEQWEAFLEWAAERGLPLKNLADWLEERGIPALPALALLAIAFVAVAGYFLFVTVAPAQATLHVTVRSVDGQPIPGATVFLASPDNLFPRKSGVTSGAGIASFTELPAGAEVRVTVQAPEYEIDAKTLKLKAGVNRLDSSTDPSFLAQPKLIQRVSLSVTVRGPGTAKVALFDSFTKEQVNEQEGVIASFDVEVNKSYEVVASSPGWRSETLFVNVTGLGDLPLDVALTKNAEDRTGTVLVTVVDAPGPLGRHVPNATIELIDNATEAVLYTLRAGEDGSAQAEEVRRGTVLRVRARAEGYLAGSANLIVSEELNRATVVLARAQPPASTKVFLTVEDIDGNPVSGAVVRAWLAGERVAEGLAVQGEASLDVPTQATLTVTAYKAGFLPASRRLRPLEESRAQLVLAASTPENAAAVKVRVTNVEGLDQPGASVALSDERREPLGLPEQITGLDGLAQFSDVPVGIQVVARAASDGRISVSEPTNVTREGTPGENATLITLALQPGQGTFAFTVLDHFSRATLDGAIIAVPDGNATCTTRRGACTLSVQEGTRRFSVSAPGYETLATSEFTVRSNVVARQTLELVSTSVAKSAQLVFLGFYDLRGRKVNALNPASTYTARYLLRSPGIAFRNARAHVRLGPQERSLAEEPAAITGFDAAGATAYAGVAYAPGAGPGEERGESVTVIGGTPTPTPAPTASPSPVGTVLPITGQQLATTSTSSPEPGLAGEPAPGPVLISARDLHRPGLREYKWVEFEFPSFNGSREFSVQFTTRPVEQARVELSHRTAFQTPAETVRDPADAEAGVRKPDVLAAVNPPQSAEISFKGECTPALCAQVRLEGSLGKSAERFEASFGEEFQLKFKLFTTAPNQAVEAVLATGAIALELADGLSGTSTAQASRAEGEQRLTLSARTNREGVAEGSFTVKAVRLSKGAPLQFSVAAGSGEEQRYAKALAVRVVGRTPNLNVQVSPASLQALKDNAVTFTVIDPFGAPVANARATLGRDGDALGTTAEAAPAPQPGRYRAEGVKPEAPGFVDFSVEAEGFRVFRGRLPVSAEDFIEVQPRTLTLAVDGKEFEKREITVRNNLRTEATVSISLLRSSQPALTEVDTDVAVLRVKPNSAATFSFLAAVSDLVLDVAQRPTTLRENVAGRIQISARAGPRAEQRVEVPFAVSTSFQQQPLDPLWELSTNSLDLEVRSPLELRSSERLAVKNDGPVPLLINVELPYYPLSAEPLSIIVPPNEQRELRLTANAVGEFLFGQGCLMDERQLSGDAVIHASFQGVRSAKRVTVRTSITSSDRCTPLGARGVWLPTNAHFQFLSPVKVKRNVDGSNVIQLPNSDRALFNPPSTVTPLEATVPAHSVIELGPQYLDFLPNGAVLRFPAQVSLALPAGITFSGAVSAPRRVLFKNIEVELPPGTQVTAGYAAGGRLAQLGASLGAPAYYSPIGLYGQASIGGAFGAPLPGQPFVPGQPFIGGQALITAGASPYAGQQFGYNPYQAYAYGQQPSFYGQPGTYGLHGSLSAQVAVIPPNAPIAIRTHSPDVPSGQAVRLPAKVTLRPPSGSIVFEAEATNQKILELPDQRRLGVPDDAQVLGASVATPRPARQAPATSISLQADVRVSLPAGAEVILPPEWVGKFTEGQENYEVRFPFAIEIELPAGKYSTARLSDGRYLVVLNRQEFLEFRTQPQIQRNLITVRANERVRFGPFRAELEGGEEIRFPAALTLTLPSGTSAIDGAEARVLELPVGGAIQEGESRLLVPYTAVLRPRNRPTSVEVKPDAEFTLPLAWVPDRSEDNYSLVLPVNAKFELPAASQAREEGGQIVVSELGALAKALTVTGGALSGRTVNAPAGSRITVFVNPPRELLRKCSVDTLEEFTVPFDAVFEFPRTSAVSENNRVFELDPPARVQVFRKGVTGRFTYQFPPGTKYHFTSGQVTMPPRFRRETTLRVVSEEEKLKVSVAAGAKVKIDLCVDNVLEREKALQVYLEDLVSFKAPDPTTWETIELPEDKQDGKGTVQAQQPFDALFSCRKLTDLPQGRNVLLQLPFATEQMHLPRNSVVLSYKLKDTPPPYVTSQAGVDVPRGSLVSFLPCAGLYSTKADTTVRFEADTASSRLRQADLNLSVELTNEKLEAEVPVRFYYEGAEPRIYLNYRFDQLAGDAQGTPAGAAFQARDGTGLIQSAYLQLERGGTSVPVTATLNEPALPLQTDVSGVYGKVIDSFKVKVQVPRGLRDDLFGCVKTEGNATVKVRLETYLDRARTRRYGGADLYFTVNVTKKGTCAGKGLALAGDLVKGFAVSYDKLSFKNKGHHRYLALTNNLPFAVTVKHKTVPSRATCVKWENERAVSGETFVTGVKLPPGTSTAVRCTGVATGQDDLDLEASAERGDITEFLTSPRKAVAITVYDAGELAQNLYTATPLGDVAAPGRGSVALCGKDYCSFEQVNDAFREFTQAMDKYVVDDIGRNVTTIRDFCTLLNRLGGGASLTKSFTFNIVETVVSPESLRQSAQCESVQDCLDQSLRNEHDRKLEAANARPAEKSRTTKLPLIALGADRSLVSCGTYRVTFRTPEACLATSSREEFLAKSTLAVEVEKVAGCEKSVANTALLTAEEPRSWVGRELAEDLLTEFVSHAPPPIGSRWALGTYREAVDKQDEQTASLLYQSLYRTSQGFNATPAQPYSQFGYCAGTGLPLIGTVGTASIAVIAAAATKVVGEIAVVAGIPDAVLSIPSLVRAIVSMSVTFTATCGAGLLTKPLGEAGACDELNICGYGAVAALADGLAALIPGAGSAASIGAQLATQTAFTAAGIGIAELIPGEELEDSVGVPSSVAAGRTAREILPGSQRYLAQVLRAAHTTGKKPTANQARKLVKWVRAGDDGAISRFASTKLGHPNPADYVNFVKGNVRQAGQATLRGRLAGNARAAIQRGARLRTISRIGISALAVLLFQVDFRPMRAIVEREYYNHLVVFHTQDNFLGRLGKVGSGDYAETIYSFCRIREDGSCEYEFEGLGTLCPDEESPACLYLTQDRKADVEKGYLLLTAVNEDKFRTQAFFDSLFRPDAAPLSAKDNAELKKAVLGYKSADELLALQQAGPSLSAIQQAARAQNEENLRNAEALARQLQAEEEARRAAAARGTR